MSPPHLPSYALFAAMLSVAGLPLYMHAPKVYADQYGLSLATLGAVLAGLRLLDVVQDPLLGRLANRLGPRRGASVAVAVLGLIAGMLGLFAIAPPIAPIWWFGAMLIVVFSTFSYLTICFYAQGVARAATLPGQGHIRLARWRESGALLGICIAAVAPVLLGGYGAFAVAFLILALVALWMMWAEWGGARVAQGGMAPVLRDPLARRLLVLALVNAAPVAVTSTLFLFFVESRLGAEGMAGPFLIVFFLSAAVAAPIWGRLAETQGASSMLALGMVLSILAFGAVLVLGPGDLWAFGLICVASGAALGADMTLLPALFAARLEQVAPGGADGFGLWSFMSKMTLAIAAAVVLPVLDLAGFHSGGANGPEALRMLTLMYGAVPCALKLAAIGLLATMTFDDGKVIS